VIFDWSQKNIASIIVQDRMYPGDQVQLASTKKLVHG